MLNHNLIYRDGYIAGYIDGYMSGNYMCCD